jgi:hypothetical protein
VKPVTVVTSHVPSGAGDPLVRALGASGLVERVDLLLPPGAAIGRTELGGLPCREITTAEPGAGDVVGALVHGTASPVLLEVHGDFDPHPTALARLVATIEAGAGMVYGDWTDATANGPVAHPVADYQRGSLEDGFAFGPLRAWSVAEARAAIGRRALTGLRFHGWYALRLEVAEAAPIVHLPEPLGTLRPTDTRASGARVFDYLTAARERQVEAEAVVTEHLDRLGALVRGPFAEYAPKGSWPVEASVVVPVRNRVRTVLDAVDSALGRRRRSRSTSSSSTTTRRTGRPRSCGRARTRGWSTSSRTGRTSGSAGAGTSRSGTRRPGSTSSSSTRTTSTRAGTRSRAWSRCSPSSAAGSRSGRTRS